MELLIHSLNEVLQKKETVKGFRKWNLKDSHPLFVVGITEGNRAMSLFLEPLLSPYADTFSMLIPIKVKVEIQNRVLSIVTELR